MDSRERIIAALNHQAPDRVPIDFGGGQTGIHKFAYLKLIEHLGLREELVISDPIQQLAQPSEAVLTRFRVDTRYVSAGASAGFTGDMQRNERDGKMWTDFIDEFGVRWSMPDDYPYYMDITHHPLAGLTLDQIEDYPFPSGDDPARFAGLRDKVLTYKKETPYAVISNTAGVVYEFCWYMRGLENLFVDMMEQPEVLEVLTDRTLAFWTDWFKLFLDEVGDIIDVICVGDDIAGQRGPLFPPRIYRDIIKPKQKQLYSYIKSRTNARIWYHGCGSMAQYIPDLIDNGVDALNPVQINADGMEPQSLKSLFGDKICFWGGGIDAQHTLPHGSPEQVRDAVRKNVEIFKPGGGYVFNSVHNIQADVPPENVVAMFDAACEFGGLPAEEVFQKSR